MNYALLENGTVTNVIWLSPGNAYDFPNAVPTGDFSVGVGDTYDGQYFYHNGERILSSAEIAYQELAEAEAAYREGVQEA